MCILRYSDGLRAGRPGLDPRQRQDMFFLLHSVDTGSGGAPSLLSNGYPGIFPRDEVAEA
jgi:hypothetical protein